MSPLAVITHAGSSQCVGMVITDQWHLVLLFSPTGKLAQRSLCFADVFFLYLLLLLLVVEV